MLGAGEVGTRTGRAAQIYPRADPADKALPPDSPMSKKLNLSYEKVLCGPDVGEYCWASTVNKR